MTDYEFATRNATAAIADALAIDRSRWTRTRPTFLDDAANATREAEKILKLVLSTQLASSSTSLRWPRLEKSSGRRRPWKWRGSRKDKKQRRSD